MSFRGWDGNEYESYEEMMYKTRPRLKKKVKDKWLSALRSGKYEQGKGRLAQLTDDHESMEYCCLGVLCETMVNPLNLKVQDPNGKYTLARSYGKGGSTGYPPLEVTETIYLKPKDGQRIMEAEANVFVPNPFYNAQKASWDNHSSKYISIAVLNDKYGLSFDKIADLIEEHL